MFAVIQSREKLRLSRWLPDRGGNGAGGSAPVIVAAPKASACDPCLNRLPAPYSGNSVLVGEEDRAVVVQESLKNSNAQLLPQRLNP